MKMNLTSAFLPRVLAGDIPGLHKRTAVLYSWDYLDWDVLRERPVRRENSYDGEGEGERKKSRGEVLSRSRLHWRSVPACDKVGELESYEPGGRLVA
mmetsp:Transcript_2055/g.5498  ORF Transcript_2055/g.5498 Transcript_2055/m.5498 type:complete len:97 (-) Transcript_2055:1576-1866(-)